MAKLGILGSQGRMGLAIAAVAPEMGHEIAGGTEVNDDPAPVARMAQALVDFTAPAALEANLAAARAAGTPVLIGTTGLNERHHALIDEAARDIAVLQTGNTSLGVVLLCALVEQAAARLGSDWDIEIVEAHHREKRDAPSGTALMLGDAAAKGLGTTMAEAGVIGRAGLAGARAPGTIGMASLRGGTIVGDHSVHFCGAEETIELTHRAQDRRIFARGAVRGAAWLIGRAPGRYAMAQVLGL